MKVPFNLPPYTGNEDQYIQQCLKGGRFAADGEFSRRCREWFEAALGCDRALLTSSCTHALEMAALLLELREGDEVIMPSYTFPSTANAFVLHGARVVFVDIRPDTLNLDEKLVEAAVTDRTRAIVPVHYAGVACEMDAIMDVADRHGLLVVEDAAQGMMSRYRGRPLGSIGQLGAFSFHETKNYTSAGEGGLLIVNDAGFSERAEIIREKGTDRAKFFRGMVDKYSWVDIGSSYLMSDVAAAFLWGQLELAESILENRMAAWTRYFTALSPLADAGLIELPVVPVHCEHNAHMFYIKVRDLEQRTGLLQELNARGLLAIFHYVPLHSARAGRVHGRFHGEDRYTTRESERLLRLPLYYGISAEAVDRVVAAIQAFFRQ